MKIRFYRQAMAVVSVLFTCLLFTGASAEADQRTHLDSRAQLNSEGGDAWKTEFQNNGRDSWQKPDEVIKMMNLAPGDIIVDIGAGDGYFTGRFAEAVGPGGLALGIEVVSSKVESMNRDARRLGLKNYRAILAETDDPGLEPGSTDVVFLCNTYHHLRNRVDYFKKASAGLRKDGRVIVVDFYNKRMDVGPPPSHTLSKEVVIEEMEAAGYQLLADRDFLAYQYFLEFGLK